MKQAVSKRAHKRCLRLQTGGCEIQEALNVIEHWNTGERSVWQKQRNRHRFAATMQELTMLALHLLQNSLVYINTLMLWVRKPGKIA